MPSRLTFTPLFLSSTVAGIVLSKLTSITTGTVLSWIYLVLLPCYVIYHSWIYPFYISPLRMIPTVPGSPLLGHSLAIITEEVGVPQRKWHQQFGPVVRYFYPLGSEKLSFVGDDALKQMTIRNPYNYPKPARAREWMARILGDGVLTAEGEAHIHQRKALAPGFSVQSIKALYPVFWRKSLLMSDLWAKEMLNEDVQSKTIEVLDWLNRTTLDIIGEAGFGSDFNSLNYPDSPLRQAYRRLFNFSLPARAFHGLQSHTVWAKYIPSPSNFDMVASAKIITGQANEIIRSKLSKANPNAKDIIALLVRENQRLMAAGEKGLTFETMRNQVMTFVGAGHDTTAVGATWTLHLISKHPEVQKKLRAEVHSRMPFLFDANLQSDIQQSAKWDVDQLPYLDNVCRESLRYIPPVPFTARRSIEDDQIGGYFIPAGSDVYMHSNVINRHPGFWGETADQFDPDRWDHLPATYTPNAYMTFQQGPRGCMGRKFAEIEIKTLLCSMLSKYRFETDETFPDQEAWKMWRVVLRPRDGMRLKVTLLE